MHRYNKIFIRYLLHRHLPHAAQDRLPVPEGTSGLFFLRYPVLFRLYLGQKQLVQVSLLSYYPHNVSGSQYHIHLRSTQQVITGEFNSDYQAMEMGTDAAVSDGLSGQVGMTADNKLFKLHLVFFEIVVTARICHLSAAAAK